MIPQSSLSLPSRFLSNLSILPSPLPPLPLTWTTTTVGFDTGLASVSVKIVQFCSYRKPECSEVTNAGSHITGILEDRGCHLWPHDSVRSELHLCSSPGHTLQVARWHPAGQPPRPSIQAGPRLRGKEHPQGTSSFSLGSPKLVTWPADLQK